MTTTKNNENKKLNFSNEREQSQACLNSAEHEKNQGRKVLNVPNLRFPEFQGEWENFLINDVCSEFKSGKNIKADSISESGEYPVYGGNGLRGYTSSYNHDGLYVLIGRQGALCGNVRSVYGKTYITEHAIAVAGNEISNTSFLHQLFLKMNLGQYSDQSAQPGLAVNKLLKLKVALPSVLEQTKIASFLSLLDERIATQNKIIDKLQSLIKGIAQNIVRNNKPNVPLSDCLECNSSTLQENDVCEHGTYPVYGANGIVGYRDNYNTESEAVYIIKDGSGVGTVSYVTGKCSATGTLNTLQAKEGYSLQYLYYLLKVFNFEPYKTGMAIPHIYFKDYGKAKVFCPSYTEQLRYARLLSAIDNKLSAEQHILTNLSMQKQYFLRQMFI